MIDDAIMVSMQSSYCIVTNLIIDCARFRLQEPSGRERWCFIEGLGWRTILTGGMWMMPIKKQSNASLQIVTRCRNDFPLAMVATDA